MSAKNFTPIDLKSLLRNKVGYGAGKEHEPILTTQKAEISTIEESVEHKISDQEVKTYVEERPEMIEMGEDLKKHGLKAVSSSVFSSYKAVKIPMADEKVVEGLRKPITSSFRWLAELAVYILRRSHLALKSIHGKVIRVISSD